MEVIVCQQCDKIIAFTEAEKAGVLYGKCPGCGEEKQHGQRRVSQTA